MSATPDSTLPDVRRSKADLQRELAELRLTLDERTHERDEALQRETATAEVLGVINSSPGDLAPVFDAMLEKAMRLCGADFGTFAIPDRGRFQTAATRGVPAAFAEYRKNNPPPYGPGTVTARILDTRSLVHITDLMAE